MIGFIIFIHALVCILLVIAILMQAGRGGGLTEGFAAAESVFGAKTSSFMVKTTSILAAIFLTTSLSLAYVSARKEQSLMTDEAAGAAPVKKMLEDIPVNGLSVSTNATR